MKKTLASLVAGIAGMLILISGLYVARIGFSAGGGDILVATILAFIGIFIIGAAIHHLSEENS